MSPETHNALNTLIFYILRCMAHSSNHVLLCVLKERICRGMGTVVVLVQQPEGNIHEEENNSQR